MMKPATVLKRWEKFKKEIHPKKPGRRKAKEFASLIGMRSILEVEVADMLDKLKVKWEYEPHKFQYHMCEGWCPGCDVKVKTYTPDFYLPKQDKYIEVKGKITLDDRKKMELVKLHHPTMDIVLVFGNANNKLSAKAKMRYWQWADKAGLPWSNKKIKKEWI